MKAKTVTLRMWTAIGIGLTAAMFVASSPVWSQNLLGEPWVLSDRMAYTVHPNGSMRILPIGDRGMAMMMKHAKPVPRGTVFFMRNGRLYTMRGGGAFDRAGNWMGQR